MKRLLFWLFRQQETTDLAEIRQRQASMLNAMLCCLI